MSTKIDGKLVVDKDKPNMRDRYRWRALLCKGRI